MARLSEHGIRLSSMSPSFLNSNSTSHTWPFSAVAELIDNASDPGVTAKQIWVDVVEEQGQLCLSFTDNGSGMTPNKLHKMLSFGFTGKGTGPASLQAIGVYGNGFKSGSMRLGRDALIFTKNGGCQSVGMLSQTYLDNIRAQAVIVPIAPFSQQTNSLVVTEDSEASLKAILTHSLITSVDQLHSHFDSIPSKKGTKILIWNIRRTKDGKPELDFETDAHDIRMPEVIIEELKRGRRSSGNLKPDQNLPNIDYSLRAYLSILYLKPRTQIILRQKKVLAKLVAKNLAHIENDVYKPQFSKDRVKVTFGMNKNKDHYGIMLYHKNRLIKSYEKVGCQIKASGQRGGVGVIGVMECNFLKPAHNKQDFEYTKEYRLTLGALGLKLNDYWREVMEKRAREREVHALEKRNLDIANQEDNDESPSWVQCEECLKWRRVPPGHYHVSPEHWNCSQNPNPRFRSCSTPEETDEGDSITPSYQKSLKKQEQSKKRDKTLEYPPKNKPHVHPVMSAPAPPAHRASHTAGKDTLTPDQTRLDAQLARSEYQATDIGNDVDTQQILTSVITHTELLHTLKATITQEQTHIEAQPRIVGRIVGKTYTELRRPPNYVPVPKQAESRILPQKEADKEILSHKRKPTWPPNGLEKRARSLDEQQSVPEAMAVELHPVKEANQPQRLPQDNATQQAPSGAVTAQNKSSITRPQCSVSTQTMVASLPSQQPAVPPEGGDKEMLAQRLAAIEKEAKRIRKQLGIQVKKTTTSQGTMTTDIPATGKPPRGAETPTVSTATRLDGCRAESESSTGQAQAPGPWVGTTQGPEAVSGQKESSEQARSKKEKRAGDGSTNTAANINLVQEKLRGIRANVVSLLSALLPQVDLAGVSVDSSDVDNILQQIIEVNSL